MHELQNKLMDPFANRPKTHFYYVYDSQFLLKFVNQPRHHKFYVCIFASLQLNGPVRKMLVLIGKISDIVMNQTAEFVSKLEPDSPIE